MPTPQESLNVPATQHEHRLLESRCTATLPQMMELATAWQTLLPINKDEELVSELLTCFILPTLQRDELQRENAQLKKIALKQAAQINTMKQACAGAHLMRSKRPRPSAL